MNKKILLSILALALTVGTVLANSSEESNDKISQNSGNFFQRLFNNNDRYNRYEYDRYDSNRNDSRYRNNRYNNNNNERYNNRRRNNRNNYR